MKQQKNKGPSVIIDRQKQSSLNSTKINYFKQFWNSLTSCCRCKSVN